MTEDARNGALEQPEATDGARDSRTPPGGKRGMWLGKINNFRAARRALVRVTEAAIAGRLEPKVANCAIYGLSSIGRLLEAEVLASRLADLEQRAEQAGLVVTRKASVRPLRLVGHG